MILIQNFKKQHLTSFICIIALKLEISVLIMRIGMNFKLYQEIFKAVLSIFTEKETPLVRFLDINIALIFIKEY